MPVVRPAAPRLTVCVVDVGVTTRVDGPVRLNVGDVTVTAALLEPTRWNLAGVGAPPQVTLPPPLPQVTGPEVFTRTTSPVKLAPASTIVPKSRSCVFWIVSGL